MTDDDLNRFYICTDKDPDQTQLRCLDCDQFLTSVDGGDPLSLYVALAHMHRCNQDPECE